jgi:hypothetical protein
MWVLDAWVPTKLRSVQKYRKKQMRESLKEFGWHMKQMCPCEMPSLTDGGTPWATL